MFFSLYTLVNCYYHYTFPAAKKPALEQRYNELLKIIGEIGKDVKPAYTNSKSHADRLKKSKLVIMIHLILNTSSIQLLKMSNLFVLIVNPMLILRYL